MLADVHPMTLARGKKKTRQPTSVVGNEWLALDEANSVFDEANSVVDEAASHVVAPSSR